MTAPRKRQKLSPSIHLKFNDLTVKVKDKYILQNITGEVKPGEILAIMGPSGAGKSTLLNFLSGRNKDMVLEKGEIIINNQPSNKQARRQIGYVVQEDTFLSHLTVKQNLQFVGKLLIPDTMTTSEKYEIVESVVDELGLRKCLDTKIGGGIFQTGCSGGEKKRCSIAAEMIKNPGMLILDEPTSGLDAAIACSLIKSIKNLAEKDNRAVITSIHQPSSHVFHMFDKLLLLCNGKVAYYGRTTRVLDFFQDLNMPCYPNWNPADFILEKVSEGPDVEDIIVKRYQEIASSEYEMCNTPTKLTKPDIFDGDGDSDGTNIYDNASNKVTDVPLSYENVSFSTEDDGIQIPATDEGKQDFVAETGVDIADIDVLKTIDGKDIASEEKWPTSFQTQFKALSKRAFIQNNQLIVDRYQIGQSIAIALIVSLMWFNTPYHETSIPDRNGVCFFAIIYLTFEPLFFTLLTFPPERATVAKERSAGMYRLSAYFFAKMVSELPILVFQPTLVYTVIYWATGLNRSPVFLAGIFMLITQLLLSQSISYCLGSLLKNLKMCISITIVFSLAMMMLGGFFTRRIPPWLHWARYISFIAHAFNIAQRLEYSYATQQFSCASNSIFERCIDNTTSWITGEEIHTVYSTMDCTIGESFAVLWGCIFLCRGLFYVILRIFNKPQ